MNSVGLSKEQFGRIIQRHLDQNADLVIGIDDPEIVQLISVLCDGIAVAMEQNNQAIVSGLEEKERNADLRF